MKNNLIFKLFLLFTLFINTDSYTRVKKISKTSNKNDNNQKVDIYYYSTLNDCYMNDYFSQESKYYYINQACFIDEDSCRNNVIKSKDFIYSQHNLRFNISKCLNNYEKKGIYIYNKCLRCNYIYVNINIKCKSYSCTYFFSIIVLIIFLLVLTIIYLICLTINRKKPKKYTLVRNN